MQILRLLAARRFRGRRAVSTITATAPCTPFYGEEQEDEGPFFDLDLASCSAPASTAASQAAESGSESDDCAHGPTAGYLDFVISLQRSRSASPSYEERLFFRGVAPPPLKFCASEPSALASSGRYSSCSSRRGSGSSRVAPALRTLSFGSAKAALYGGRASFSRSSTNARSTRLWYGSPDLGDRDVEASRPHSGDVFRRYLTMISSRLRKSRSASAAGQSSPPPARRDDTLLEKQDGIASAIAHCKESFRRGTCGRRLVPPLICRSQHSFFL
jgi:hypothetical protein